MFAVVDRQGRAFDRARYTDRAAAVALARTLSAAGLGQYRAARVGG